MNKTDYNREFNSIIEKLKCPGNSTDPDAPRAGADTVPAHPRLLLHACCAPCSSICMERVRDHFDTTVYFFNPNITIEDEYIHRSSELKRLIDIYNDMAGRGKIDYLEGEYSPESFYEMAKGYEDCPERGTRCHLCYELRLRAAMKAALAGGFDYFATTLTLSPLKDAEVLNSIGYRLAGGTDGKLLWLPSDFKKEDGYKKSIELSRRYGLYRQNYCGCIYSKPKTEEL